METLKVMRHTSQGGKRTQSQRTVCVLILCFFFSSRRRHTRWNCDWSSDVCSSDLRRVRLGLLLSEVGRQNNIQVTADELNRAVLDEARRYPGQERKVYEWYQKNPDMVARLRAPIYEDKIIDFVLELVKTTERKVSPQELNEEFKASASND